MELNLSGESVVQKGSRVCESPLIGGAVPSGVEESGVHRNVEELIRAFRPILEL